VILALTQMIQKKSFIRQFISLIVLM